MARAKRVKAKICLVGEKMVGKTSLIRRYVLDQFDDSYITTLGAKVSKKDVSFRVGETAVHVSLGIWDFMGQEGFREVFQDAYFSGARGILAVCDLTRVVTLDALGPWIDSVRRVAGDQPTILAANKADLVGQEAIREEDLLRFASRHRCASVRTSAKTGANVEDAFLRLAKIVAEYQTVLA